jgi:hypothetical protein
MWRIDPAVNLQIRVKRLDPIDGREPAESSKYRKFAQILSAYLMLTRWRRMAANKNMRHFCALLSISCATDASLSSHAQQRIAIDRSRGMN